MNNITNNKFFTTTTKQAKVFGRSLAKGYLKVSPKGGKSHINICDNFDWKLPGYTDEVPRVYAEERELIYGSYTTSILALIQQAGQFASGLAGNPNGGADIYPQLYASKKTGFTYEFPHLLTSGSKLYSINNSWTKINNGPQEMLNNLSKSGNNSGTGEKLLGGMLSFGAGLVTPGFGFDDIYQYQGTQLRMFPISFPLYNTLSIESAYENYCFINLFSMQNLKIRTSLATYIPPKIYILSYGNTQGGIYSPIAIVQDFSVESIGTARKMTEFKSYGLTNVLIPEAYKVTITFMELIQNSSNIYAGSIGGDKIEVANAVALIDKFLEKSTPTQNQQPLNQQPLNQNLNQGTNSEELNDRFPNAVPLTPAEIAARNTAQEADEASYNNNRAKLQDTIDQYKKILPLLNPSGQAYSDAVKRIEDARRQLAQ
jgi:hypothetical protein